MISIKRVSPYTLHWTPTSGPKGLCSLFPPSPQPRRHRSGIMTVSPLRNGKDPPNRRSRGDRDPDVRVPARAPLMNRNARVLDHHKPSQNKNPAIDGLARMIGRSLQTARTGGAALAAANTRLRKSRKSSNTPRSGPYLRRLSATRPRRGSMHGCGTVGMDQDRQLLVVRSRSVTMSPTS